MTLLLLLFALVVAGRPLFLTPSTALQAAFQVHPGKDDLNLDPAHFPHQIEHVSFENIASFEFPPGQHVFDEPALSQHQPEQGAVAPLVVLAFSCLAAFLALICIVSTLYILKALRFQFLAAWEFLPRFWWRPTSKHLLGEVRLPASLLDAEQVSAETHDHTQQAKMDAVSDTESEWDDVDEKYLDALDTTPLALFHDLPHEQNVSQFDGPPLLLCPPDQPTTESADHSTPLMHELELYSSPISRPAWSVRAMDSPALGLSLREADGVASTPHPLVHPRRRAYRTAVPEFDIALAMQLRPGLGIGADSAWMVRFLMTIFGWFAVALTGSTR